MKYYSGYANIDNTDDIDSAIMDYEAEFGKLNVPFIPKNVLLRWLGEGMNTDDMYAMACMYHGGVF